MALMNGADLDMIGLEEDGLSEMSAPLQEPPMRRSSLVLLLAVIACGAPPVQPAPGTPSPVAGRYPDTSALARDIPQLLRESDVPGLSIALVQAGRVVWTRAYGTVGDSARTPLDPGTVFEAASMSKPVFAYLVMRLADRGELDLDRPLYEILEYPRLAHDDRYKRITARIVLSHGTGLPNWGGDTLTLRFDPGTEYGYSGEGFVFLQKAIERLTGRTLDELARAEVFEPLGMRRSSYVWQPRFAGHEAYARKWLWTAAPVNHWAEGNAAASLLTTAGDYARFVAAVMTGKGLSPARWQEYLTPVRESAPGLGVALGIRVEERPGGKVFYHSGSNGRRFTCYMTGDMARGIGLAYFTNAYNGTTLVEAIASRTLGRDDPPSHWAVYDRYDEPRRLAGQSVRRAAAEQGETAARDRLREIQADSTTRPTFDGIIELGDFFTGRGLGRLAVEVLRETVAAFPDSAEAHRALGHALESTGDLRGAIAEYRRAGSLQADAHEMSRLIRWTEERVATLRREVTVPRSALERYVGTYQERTIRLRGDRLYYASGMDPESRLVPMAEDLFEVVADPTVRLRFVGDRGRPAVKLIGLSSDGGKEEWPRSN
jgi:CubicO group peptidase (beta-lactamase class C family)